MPSIKFRDDEHRKQHNAKANEYMKKHYKMNGGKLKTKLYYYKRLYREEPEFTQLIDAFDNIEDKIREAKKYHLEQKIKTI